MSETLDEVTRRLAQVQDALLDLPPGPSAERYALLVEQDRLREVAREHSVDWDAQRSTDEIEAELASFRELMGHLIRERTGHVSSGGSSGGPTPGSWVGLGKSALTSTDVDRLRARISELETLLESRG